MLGLARGKTASMRGIRSPEGDLAPIGVDNRPDGGLDAAAMGSVRGTKMSRRILGSVIGAALLFALPVSPQLSNSGGIMIAFERANAADLEANPPIHRKARQHVEAYAEPVYEDPRYLAYCSGNNHGGFNGGTYRGGIFMDLNCYGYVAGDRSGEFRGWGLPGRFIWW